MLMLNKSCPVDLVRIITDKYRSLARLESLSKDRIFMKILFYI